MVKNNKKINNNEQFSLSLPSKGGEFVPATSGKSACAADVESVLPHRHCLPLYTPSFSLVRTDSNEYTTNTHTGRLIG